MTFQKILLQVAVSILFSLLLVAAGCKKQVKGSGGDELSKRCGHCLSIESGNVCTPVGTLKNSCFAICSEQKILCNQTCPCPEKKK